MRAGFIHFCACIALIGSLEAFSAKKVARWCGIGTAGIGTVVALRLHKKAVALEKKLVEKSLVQQARRSRNRALTGALLGAGVAVGSLFMRDDEIEVPVALSEPGERTTLIPIPVSREVESVPNDFSIANESGNSMTSTMKAFADDFLRVPNVIINDVSEVVVSAHQARLADVVKAATPNSSAQGYVAFSTTSRSFNEGKALKLLGFLNKYCSISTDLDPDLDDDDKYLVRAEQNAQRSDLRKKLYRSYFLETLFDVVEVPLDGYCAYHAYFFNLWWHTSGLARDARRPVAFAANLSLIKTFRELLANKLEAQARRGPSPSRELQRINSEFRSESVGPHVWTDPTHFEMHPFSNEFLIVGFGELTSSPDWQRISPDRWYYINVGNHWVAARPKPEVIALLEREQ
ncbi:MAG: hypothetical protein QG632_425 [Candidatus Dependentiae bacterium]|nr:hypothetical protein [Candidatus Dependentiae bacterium]